MAHLLTILMAMGKMNISCGFRVGQQAIVLGASSLIGQLDYVGSLRLGSSIFISVEVHGVRYLPIPVKEVIGVSYLPLPIVEAIILKPLSVPSREIIVIRSRS
jgi:hypothetical protein